MPLKSSYTSQLSEAGVDEVGRGCLAGPVVAAAVILPKDYFHSKLNDSKLLSIKVREQLRDEIIRESISFAIAQIDNREIDKINILNASFKAMSMAIDTLEEKPDLLLIDGNKFPGYGNIPHKCIVKGDSKYFSIAAASVLAKTFRDEYMAEQSKIYEHYGWEENMGYATRKHRLAIEEFGTTPLHRQSFLKNKDQLTLFNYNAIE